MGGHNKWSQIKRQKGAADASKSNIWGKLSQRIALESKKAGGDINTPTLRAIIEKAKSVNMPKDKIDRAVARGISDEASEVESVIYETYGPGGAAILISALTDNRNRTAQEIKHILSENGLSLAAPGSAAWAFQKTVDGYDPKTTVPLEEAETKKLDELLEKIGEHDDVEDIFTNAA